MTTRARGSVLLADDEPGILKTLRRALRVCVRPLDSRPEPVRRPENARVPADHHQPFIFVNGSNGARGDAVRRHGQE